MHILKQCITSTFIFYFVRDWHEQWLIEWSDRTKWLKIHLHQINFSIVWKINQILFLLSSSLNFSLKYCAPVSVVFQKRRKYVCMKDKKKAKKKKNTRKDLSNPQRGSSDVTAAQENVSSFRKQIKKVFNKLFKLRQKQTAQIWTESLREVSERKINIKLILNRTTETSKPSISPAGPSLALVVPTCSCWWSLSLRVSAGPNQIVFLSVH